MRAVFLFLFLTVSLPALAIDDMAAFEDPALQARYYKLSNELRCLVCQNQSIADSTADLAGDLREQVREMLLEGSSDAEILDYMTDRYGDFVRYRPAFTPRTWALWLGPIGMLLVGLLIVGLVVRRYVSFEPGATGE